MNKLTLINIPVGERGMINGKCYEAQKTDIFGAANCFVCDLHVPGEGCNNRNVVCYCPPRTFKEVTPDYYDYNDDYDEWADTKVWQIVVIIILLCFPMVGCWIWEKILTLGIYIINKINKIREHDTNK